MALVLAASNPAGYSYFHWVGGDLPSFTPAQAVLGIALLALDFPAALDDAADRNARPLADGGAHRWATGKATVDEADDNR